MLTKLLALLLLALSAACSSSTLMQQDAGTDGGPDGGPTAAPWDLRFKGVGSPFTIDYLSALGAEPGDNTLSVSQVSPGANGTALVGGGGIFVAFLTSATQPLVYAVTAVAPSVTCPTYLSEAMAANNIVTALEGDPLDNTNTCAILSIGEPDGGPEFAYMAEDAVSTAHISDALAASVSARSFVVTAIVQVDAGLYTYVAESIGPRSDGGYEQFDTLIQEPLVGDLAGEVAVLADAGYVITASAWQGEPTYTLVGTRLAGSTATHAATTVMGTGTTFSVDTSAMLANGYAQVSAMGFYYYLDDGGVGSNTWLIGEK